MGTFLVLTNKDNYQKNKNINLKNSKYIFDNYYNFKDYSLLKPIIGEKKVMSIGIDPFVAFMNDIKVIDGYHPIYPLSYKRKFKKIISSELDNNETFKHYYETWGSRVYAFYEDKNNILINFNEAKILGAEYVISAVEINNDKLTVVKIITPTHIFYHDFPNICFLCRNTDKLFLYKIL